MDAPSVDHHFRPLTIPRSRRQMLRGLAAAAALGLLPRTTQRALAGGRRLYDLSAAILLPDEVAPDSSWAVGPSRSFLGLEGGVAGQVVSERLAQTLQPVSNTLVGGHYSVLLPLDPNDDRRTIGESYQFTNGGTARDGFAAIQNYYAGATRDPASSDQRALFNYTTQGQDGSPVKVEVGATRAGRVVYVVTNVTPGSDSDTQVIITHLETVAPRLREISADDHDGLGGSVPTVNDFGETMDLPHPCPPGWWEVRYLKRNKATIRQQWQSDDDYDRFADWHAEAQEGVIFLEVVPGAGNGEGVIARVEAHRFGGNKAAANYLTQIPPRLQQVASTEGFLYEAVPNPPALRHDVNPVWYRTIHQDDAGFRPIVGAWIQDGRDALGLSVYEMQPRPPADWEQNRDGIVDALTKVVAFGADGYILTKNLGGWTESELRRHVREWQRTYEAI